MGAKKKSITSGKPKKQDGRPSIYTEELANKICEIVATNPVGLPTLCKMFPEIPSHETINQWRWRYSSFADRYVKSKQFQAELMAESIEDVITETVPDIYRDENGNRKLDSGIVGLARLKIDSRKWTAAKLAPKIYGDRMQIQTTNNEENEQLKSELKELREKLAEKSKSEY